MQHMHMHACIYVRCACACIWQDEDLAGGICVHACAHVYPQHEGASEVGNDWVSWSTGGLIGSAPDPKVRVEVTGAEGMNAATATSPLKVR